MQPGVRRAARDAIYGAHGVRLIPYPGQASLRRGLGSRKRTLAALVPDGQRSFPNRRPIGLEPASPALLYGIACGETSWPPGTTRCAGPGTRGAAT